MRGGAVGIELRENIVSIPPRTLKDPMHRIQSPAKLQRRIEAIPEAESVIVFSAIRRIRKWADRYESWVWVNSSGTYFCSRSLNKRYYYYTTQPCFAVHVVLNRVHTGHPRVRAYIGRYEIRRAQGFVHIHRTTLFKGRLKKIGEKIFELPEEFPRGPLYYATLRAIGEVLFEVMFFAK